MAFDDCMEHQCVGSGEYLCLNEVSFTATLPNKMLLWWLPKALVIQLMEILQIIGPINVNECPIKLFFSLGISAGMVINYAAYNEFHHDIYRDGLILSCTDTFTSTLAGITIFSILGNLAHVSGVSVRKVHLHWYNIRIAYLIIRNLIGLLFTSTSLAIIQYFRWSVEEVLCSPL